METTRVCARSSCPLRGDAIYEESNSSSHSSTHRFPFFFLYCFTNTFSHHFYSSANCHTSTKHQTNSQSNNILTSQLSALSRCCTLSSSYYLYCSSSLFSSNNKRDSVYCRTSFSNRHDSLPNHFTFFFAHTFPDLETN